MPEHSDRQMGHWDPLASAEDLTKKQKGRYDPRTVSGKQVAVRVRIVCAHCGDLLGRVVDFEERLLYHTAADGRWRVSWPGLQLKCRNCYPPMSHYRVDLQTVQDRLDAARRENRTKVCKLRSTAAKL
jgi:hypothetical protein